MPRLFTVLALALGSAASGLGADADMSRFNAVSIKPATTYILIASVSLTMPTFSRKKEIYSSTYSARVFPYFYFNEKGRIWIVVPDDALRHVANGESIDFRGHAISESGDDRRVEGHASPTGPSRGNIRVRIFVSRRIALNYDTTYELLGTAAPTPR